MSKSKQPSRREAVAQIRAKQKAAERRRTLLALTPAVVLAVVIAVVVVLQVRDQSGSGNAQLTEVGARASEVCQQVTTQPVAQDAGEHRQDGVPIDYQQAPPAAAPHWGQFLQSAQIRKFWTTDDRPPVEQLLHSVEHGWTIVWYDESLAEDDAAVDDLEAIADAYAGTAPEDKVMVAPWTAADGGGFPGDATMAITHWSMGGTNGNPEGQVGVTRYCSAVSGEAVDDFVADYPFSDAPEPGAP